MMLVSHDGQHPGPRPGGRGPDGRLARAKWPATIVGFIAFNMTISLTMLYVALRDGPPAVEDRYYEQAVEWDSIARRRRESAALGWIATTTVGETAAADAGRRRVCLSLSTSDQRGLDGAKVSLVAFPQARADRRQTVTLTPEGDGRYACELPVDTVGWWELRYSVTRGPQEFVRTESVLITGR